MRVLELTDNFDIDMDYDYMIPYNFSTSPSCSLYTISNDDQAGSLDIQSDIENGGISRAINDISNTEVLKNVFPSINFDSTTYDNEFIG